MRIDNLSLIEPFLKFDSEDDFYYLQILQRKKENPQLGSNSRVIKNYYISSLESLTKRYHSEIIPLCDEFNARAMLRLNKRSYRKVAFKAMQNIANSMCNDEYKFIRSSYDRAVGQSHNDKNKKWILDIDDHVDRNFLLNLRKYLMHRDPLDGVDKVLLEIPTKNGIHVITKPFDRRDFGVLYPNIEIHKDNPVNLYIP
jgi:hypothetical protein